MPKLIPDYDAPMNFRVPWETKWTVIAVAYYIGYYGKYADTLRWMIDKSLKAFFEELAQKPEEQKRFQEILDNVKAQYKIKTRAGIKNPTRHDLAEGYGEEEAADGAQESPIQDQA